jgi:hypothetical protein
MLILSRKRGESIIMPGGPAFSTMAVVVPSFSGEGEPSGGGGGLPPACPALVAILGPSASRGRRRSGPDRRRDSRNDAEPINEAGSETRHVDP